MASPAWAGLEVGQTPKTVELKGDLGGRLDGNPWSSNELTGKVHVIFYADPDEKDLNNDTSDALRAGKFSTGKNTSLSPSSIWMLPGCPILQSPPRWKRNRKSIPTPSM